MRKTTRSSAPLPRPAAEAAFLEAAFQASADGLARLALDGTLLDVNPSGLLALRGDGAGPVIGRTWCAFWHELDRPAMQAVVRQAAQGSPGTVSARLIPTAASPATSADQPRGRAADGSSSWLVTLSPVRGSGGSPESLLATYRGTTGQESAEQAFRRSAKLNEALVEAVSEMVWHYDVTTGLTGRRGWQAFTGQPSDPRFIEGWLDLVHPDDKELALSATDRAMAAHEPLTIEYRLHHHSGTWRWVEDHATPLIGEDGRPSDWIGIMTDIHDRKIAEQALRTSEERLRLAIEATGLGTWDMDLRTGELQWSDEQKRLFGLTVRESPSEDAVIARLHADDRNSLIDHFEAMASHYPQPVSNTVRTVHADTGQVRWIRSQGRLVRDHEGQPVRRIGTCQDVTEQQETRQALQVSLRRQKALIDATSAIVWRYDPAEQTVERHGWSAFTGEDSAGGIEKWLASVHPDDGEQLRSDARSATIDGRSYTTEYRLRHHTGQWRWVQDHGVPLRDADDRITEWVGIISDIHDRKRAEHEVWLVAHTDALTGIANRTLFQARLDAAVLDAKAQARSTGLVIVDLDRFKEVNDTLGHDAGDAVLRTVAERLNSVAPDAATVARLGGDEFGVILPGVTDLADVANLAARILVALDPPLLHAGREVECRASIGWSACPDHDAGPSALLKNADIALYAAKSDGRRRALAFNAGMRAEMERRLTVLRQAREALVSDAVLPFFQPKISLETGRIDGFEALLRWTDEGGGLRTPGMIQEALDDPELSVRLGARMLERVVEQMRLWKEQGVPFGHVAVNVAAAEFQVGSYFGRVTEALARAGLDPSNLEVEVTERVLLDDGTSAVEVALRDLDRAGIAIALDDFGTGYASLTHLKTFPVSCLKIDRSFIQTLESDKDSAAIVRAVLGLARSIGIKVVAEGVETPLQCRFLKRAGCDVAQGFLFAKPMAGSRVPAFLRSIAGERSGVLERA